MTEWMTEEEADLRRRSDVLTKQIEDGEYDVAQFWAMKQERYNLSRRIHRLMYPIIDQLLAPAGLPGDAVNHALLDGADATDSRDAANYLADGLALLSVGGGIVGAHSVSSGVGDASSHVKPTDEV